jgi:hypothetical protein
MARVGEWQEVERFSVFGKPLRLWPIDRTRFQTRRFGHEQLECLCDCASERDVPHDVIEASSEAAARLITRGWT